MDILKKITNKKEKVHGRIVKFCKKAPYVPRWVVFIGDLLIAFIAFTLTNFICYNLHNQIVALKLFVIKALIYLFFTAIFFYLFKTYKGIIRYSTYRDALRLFISLFLANLSLFLVNETIFHMYGWKLYLAEIGFFINFALAFLALFSVRMFIRVFYDYTRSSPTSSEKETPMLMYGISPKTVELAKIIVRSSDFHYKLEGFLVSDLHAANKTLLNLPVYYEGKDVEKLLREKQIKALMIDPIELDRNEKRKIEDLCLKYKIELLSTPIISDWKDQRKSLKKVRKVRIEELLGRIPIEIDVSSIGKSLEGQCVLVTGAAGSIGSELVRQISKFNPRLLLLCDLAETPTHLLQLELIEKYPHLKFCPVISDVRNFERMEDIFGRYKPQFIYHAAGYKHVPLMEEHPCEAVLTNVLGTRNVAYLSVKYNAEVFVMISTDKAVNPSNIMGVSKRIAEIYVQSVCLELQSHNRGDSTQKCNTRFITTRFGNVLGSNGSVIPYFEKQIEKGGPVTVTHKDVIRYFMTIREACRLVLEAGNMGKGGEIFVFEMGDPVHIVDLAERMIKLSGYRPYKDIRIEFTGLRPGEKLYEELLNDEEHVIPTHNRKIKIGKVREQDFSKVVEQMSALIASAKSFNNEETVKLMKEIVPEYNEKPVTENIS